MKFIIWAYSYDDTVGGNIALHLLCRRLNEMGETALVWPLGRPGLAPGYSMGELARAVRWELGRIKRPSFKTGPFNNPIATRRDLDGAVVVYPEIVAANPLRAPRVVRWLLHKPGFHTGEVRYSQTDLFFHYQDGFQDPDYPSAGLTLSWLNEAYRDRGGKDRNGSAYLIRKGKGRQIVHDLTDSVCVDDLSHEERAHVFNRVRFFYSYDLYTMYSRYAAICGCTPVIIPDPQVSPDQWAPREEDRYGLAYGVENIPWAIATRSKLLVRLKEQRQEEDRMLRDFVRECRRAFG